MREGSVVPVLEDPEPLVTTDVSAPRAEGAMHGDTLIEVSIVSELFLLYFGFYHAGLCYYCRLRYYTWVIDASGEGPCSRFLQSC